MFGSGRKTNKTPLRNKTKRHAAKAKRSLLKQRTAPAFIAADFLANAGDGRAVIKYRNRQTIFAQGDAADSIFFVREGRVKITMISEYGKEAVVAIFDKGEFFGEACLGGQTQRIATARAMTDCEITRMEKNIVARALQRELSLSALFLEHALRRTIRLESDLVDQFFNSCEKRLARALLMLANFGKDGGPEPVISKISQETLAEMIGTTRSRVCFFMNKFRKLGFVSYSGSTSGADDSGAMKIHSSLLNAVLSGVPQHINTDAGEQARIVSRRANIS